MTPMHTTHPLAPSLTHTVNLGQLLREKLLRDRLAQAELKQRRKALLYTALNRLTLDLEAEIEDGSHAAKADLLLVLTMMDELNP